MSFQGHWICLNLSEYVGHIRTPWGTAGEPAKAGWDAFTTDSQAIVSTHLADFQTEAVSIAQETDRGVGVTKPSNPRMWHEFP